MVNTVTFHRGDVRDVMAAMPDASVDLLVTSPPFLALRSYLPADHVDKAREIGSEATPAAYLDTMLALTAEWRRLVTATGSICVEIGDTYSGSGNGPDAFKVGREGSHDLWLDESVPKRGGPGWPLAKSLCGIPTLYAWSLAYGRNLLTGADSPAGRWRIRNLLTWTRPNPPVGALGDKYRPATSFVTVACTSDKRWFDLDAVRGPGSDNTHARLANGITSRPTTGKKADNPNNNYGSMSEVETAGAPPLDWWDDDWQPLHRLPTAPYTGTHYAAYPITLPRRLIESMCPRQVCTVCGEGRRRIVGEASYVDRRGITRPKNELPSGLASIAGNPKPHGASKGNPSWSECRSAATFGWSDCGHDNYRPGVVLDPFAGSGTTAVAAALSGRDAVLVDLDARNVDLCRRRLAETMLILDEHTDGDTVTWTVRHDMPGLKGEHPDQLNLFTA